MNASPVATRLLATKLFLPAIRPSAVARPRLVARLLAGLQTRLTLIVAPAGFGKSTFRRPRRRWQPCMRLKRRDCAARC